nr:MAG TPA: hypothetical protein [Caudoviricetes sp.]
MSFLYGSLLSIYCVILTLSGSYTIHLQKSKVSNQCRCLAELLIVRSCISRSFFDIM